MHHDLPDKIFAEARDGQYRGSEAKRSASRDEGPDSRRKRPKYRDSTTSEEEEEEEEEGDDDSDDVDRKPNRSGRHIVKTEESDDEEDDDSPVQVYQDNEMGQRGEPFTDADMYIAAKHISDFQHWDTAMSKDRWTAFAKKVLYSSFP